MISHMLTIPSVTLFNHWLYNQGFPDVKDEHYDWSSFFSCTTSTPEDMVDFRFSAYIHAYVLGDRLLAANFRCAITKDLTQMLKTHHFWNAAGVETVIFAFKNIPADRVILQYLVEDYRYHWNASTCAWIRKEEYAVAAQASLPAPFLLRVMRSYHEAECQRGLKKEKGRCFEEHVTQGEESECDQKHMFYDYEKDHGYFD
jgi:hypothetical protein